MSVHPEKSDVRIKLDSLVVPNNLGKVRHTFSEGLNKLDSVRRKSLKKSRNCFDDFTKFINRGSVVDLAIGMIIGAAFTTIVSSLVHDIIGPFMALTTPHAGLAQMFIILKENGSHQGPHHHPTIEEANKTGVVTWNYGRFLETIINFFIVALAMFLIVKLVAAIWRKNKAQTTDWPCPKCREAVKLGAVRCPHCCAEPISPAVADIDHSDVVDIEREEKIPTEFHSFDDTNV